MSTINQITLILISSVFIGGILKYLKQPIFLAHIIVGLFVASYFIPNSDLSFNQQLFEIVASVLLFISGLNVNLKHLNDLGKNAIIKNILNFLIIALVFYFLLSFLGFDVLESIVLSLTFSLSSSVALSKVAHDDLLHRSLFNKIASSHLVVQSVFLVMVLIFLSGFSFGKFSENSYEVLINNLVKTIILLVNLYLFSRYIISRIEKFIVTSNEFLFLFIVGFGFSVVSLFRFLNLSIELGALVAGILLSIHSFSFEIISKLKVLRELSLLSFFILLGAGINFEIISEKILLLFVLFLFIVLIKVFFNLFIEKLFSTSIRDNFFSSLSLTSISEFSIIIILIGVSNGILNYDVFSIVGFLYILLIVLNVYLINHRSFLYDKYFDFIQLFKSKNEIKNNIKNFDVILVGCGKLGFDFVESYKYLKSKFLVVDYDFDVLGKLKKLKINNIYGDISDMEFFESLPYLDSKLIYLSFKDIVVVKEILQRLKSKKYSGIKIAVSYNYEDTLELYRLGVDYVVMPEYISGKFVSDLTLNLGFEPKKYLPEKALHLESLKTRESHNF